MKDWFDVVFATIPGTDHTKKLLWKNNQDAVQVRLSDGTIIAVVADGCGSGAYSEFGARMGSHMFAELLSSTFATHSGENPEELFEGIRLVLISRFAAFLEQTLGAGSRSRYIIDHLLFTLLAAVVTPKVACIAGIGDGVYALNGEVKQIGPFPGNEPPYFAYGGLVKSSVASELCRFTLHAACPTEELHSLCIGTDGVADFNRISGATLPGKTELVGPLSQFWTEDRFFKNQEALRRRLNLINSPHAQPNWQAGEMDIQNGRLPDDTTLVVLRRRPQPKA